MNPLVHSRITEALRQLELVEKRLKPQDAGFDNLHRLLREVELANLEAPSPGRVERASSVPGVFQAQMQSSPAPVERPKFAWLCCFGVHKWEGDVDNIPSTTGRGPIVLGWKQCSRCAESKLTCILR